MAKIKGRKKRAMMLKIKRKKYAKIKKLRERYLSASSQEKEKIKEKILKLSPQYPIQNLETTENR